jgi:hypothetical protein
MYLQLYRSAILCTLAFFFSPSIANANSYLRADNLEEVASEDANKIDYCLGYADAATELNEVISVLLGHGKWDDTYREVVWVNQFQGCMNS